MKPSDKADKLVVKTVHIGLQNGSFALLLDFVLNLAAGLVNHFLNAGRVYASVGDKLFESYPRNLAPCLIEAGQGDRLGSVVYNKVNARKSFKGTYIPSLSADNASLHFIVWKRHYRNSGLGNLIGSALGHRKGNKVSRPFLAFVLQLCLVLLYFQSLVVDKVVFQH